MTNLSTNNILSFVAVFCSFLLLTLTVSLITSSPEYTEATTTSASAGSSAYSASISNDDTVSIPITPTSTQTEYTTTNNITFSNTCTAGSYIYINTNSTTNNSLTRTGSDTGVKTISAVAGASGLTDNTWGFKVDGKAFSQVPVSTTPAVLYSSTSVETNKTIGVTYGVKLDNTLPSGTYTNDVVYTVVVDNRCLQYTLSFVDEDGTTTLYPNINVNYGSNVDLSAYTPTKTGYTFAGWTNGSNIYTGNTNPNTSNAMAVVLRASYEQIGKVYNFDYTGSEQTFTPKVDGYYQVELWGAQGGSGVGTVVGGKGGYTSGKIFFDRGLNLSIYVGQDNPDSTESNRVYNNYSYTILWSNPAYGGGGSTDVRISGGNVYDFDSIKTRIMVAAGGGGAQVYFSPANGGNAGGLVGYDGVRSNGTDGKIATGGTQTSPGDSSSSSGRLGVVGHAGWAMAGGGNGWYPGGQGPHGTGTVGSGGGGSSFIAGHNGCNAVNITASTSSGVVHTGSSTVTYNGKNYTFTNTIMIDGAGYSWTNTKGSLQQMPNPSGGYYASGVGHSGNGYARITYLGTSI